MRLKIDENLPAEIAELLRQQGHDALTVPDQQLAGQPDLQVANVCQAEDRALITLDLDFSDIRHYPPGNYPGIVILRPRIQNRTSLIALMNRLIPLLGQQPLDGSLWIVDEHQVRIRGAGQQGTP